MSTIGITGGTGFIGTALSRQLLGKGHEVVVFSRAQHEADSGLKLQYAVWDPARHQIDSSALGRLDALVHLAGAAVVDKRWTAARRQEIIQSRVNATSFLVEQMKQHAKQCNSFIAASAIGIYGPNRQGFYPYKESSLPSSDFLAKVCKLWEAASMKAQGICRTVLLRFGIVLGQGGGAYQEFTKPMRYGIKPVLGDGKQVVSWIELDDLVNLIDTALRDKEYSGVYNAVAPNPVTHRELMNVIARVKGGKITAPVPSWLLRLIMGEASSEVLKSCTVSAQKLLSTGFSFRYPTISAAVAGLEGAN